MPGKVLFIKVAEIYLSAARLVQAFFTQFFRGKGGLQRKTGVYSFWANLNEERYLSAICWDEKLTVFEENPASPFRAHDVKNILFD